MPTCMHHGQESVLDSRDISPSLRLQNGNYLKPTETEIPSNRQTNTWNPLITRINPPNIPIPQHRLIRNSLRNLTLKHPLRHIRSIPGVIILVIQRRSSLSRRHPPLRIDNFAQHRILVNNPSQDAPGPTEVDPTDNTHPGGGVHVAGTNDIPRWIGFMLAEISGDGARTARDDIAFTRIRRMRRLRCNPRLLNISVPLRNSCADMNKGAYPRSYSWSNTVFLPRVKSVS